MANGHPHSRRAKPAPGGADGEPGDARRSGVPHDAVEPAGLLAARRAVQRRAVGPARLPPGDGAAR